MVEASSDTGAALHTEVFPEEDEAVLLAAPNPALPSLPAVGGKPLRFASAEAVAPRTLPAAEPRKRARCRAYPHPFDLAVVALMIVCAAACAYRLFWAMQP